MKVSKTSIMCLNENNNYEWYEFWQIFGIAVLLMVNYLVNYYY